MFTESMRESFGRALVVFSGKFKDYCNSIGVSNIMVSISHSKNYATATAIAIKED